MHTPHDDTLGIYPSRHITGTTVSRHADQFCLREASMKLFFEQVRQTIDRSSQGDVDGEEFEAYLGSWLITLRHHYRTRTERGGDHYCGVWETIEVVERDELEVLSAYDEKYEQSLPGLVWRLNDFYKKQRHAF